MTGKGHGHRLGLGWIGVGRWESESANQDFRNGSVSPHHTYDYVNRFSGLQTTNAPNTAEGYREQANVRRDNSYFENNQDCRLYLLVVFLS